MTSATRNSGRAEDETGTFGDGGSAAQASGRAPAAKTDSKGLVYGTVLTMKSPASGRGFSGRSLVTFINRKLGSYSWRPLDRHDPFDAAVQALGLLEVKNGPDGTPDCFYDKRRLTVPDAWRMLNVPLPLVLIVELLHRVRLLRVQTDPQQKGKIVPFSKDFKCYELV